MNRFVRLAASATVIFAALTSWTFAMSENDVSPAIAVGTNGKTYIQRHALGEITAAMRQNRDLRAIIVHAQRIVDTEGVGAPDFPLYLRMMDFTYSVLDRVGTGLHKAETQAEADLASELAEAVLSAEENSMLADLFEQLTEAGVVEDACNSDPKLVFSVYCTVEPDTAGNSAGNRDMEGPTLLPPMSIGSDQP